MNVVKDRELYDRLRSVLERGWVRLPDYPGFRGTGGPGLVLEDMLGLKNANSDTPDAGKWEIKFHSRNALLTMFHLEAQPKDHMHIMVRTFGWLDNKGRTSFRHTIRGRSSRGFYVANESNRITVRHPDEADVIWPYWSHDDLVNAFAQKMRRLIVVKGRKRKQPDEVCYERADLYWDPRTLLLPNLIEQGVIAIDFDARTNNGRGLRNHGTKFRISMDDIGKLYTCTRRFEHKP